MIRWLALLMLLALHHPATAQVQPEGFTPGLYRVTGVAADDVLNIRAAPTAAAALVGSYAPATDGIEVVALNEAGTWGMVGLPEGNGWVSMAFLERQPADTGALPLGLRCGGTEPFWSLAFESGSSASYASPEVPGLRLEVQPVRSVHLPADRLTGFDAGAPGLALTGLVRPALCSDGMSDRLYGWMLEMIERRTVSHRLVHGCCTLQPAP